jgi:hypothetical protein
MAPQVLKKNPNASVGATGGSLGVAVVWAAGNLFHWSISAEQGALLATLITAVSLFVGRNGLKGIVGIVWRGSPPQTQG